MSRTVTAIPPPASPIFGRHENGGGVLWRRPPFSESMKMGERQGECAYPPLGAYKRHLLFNNSKNKRAPGEVLVIFYFSLKEIVTFDSVIFPRFQAAILETVFRCRMDKDHFFLTFRAALYLRARCDALSSHVALMGSLSDVCLSAQKPSSSSINSILFMGHHPFSLRTHTNLDYKR